MSPPNASNQELPAPTPPPLTPHRRQTSIRLSLAWVDEDQGADNVAAVNDSHNTSGRDTDMPTVVAFFPLPAEEETAPPSPRSPRSKRVSVPGATPGAVVELSLPELPMATSLDEGIDTEKKKAEAEERLTEGDRTSTLADQDTDAAAAAVSDFRSDESFSSVGTVASREFSEGMADEIWEDIPMGPPDAILGIAAAFRACTHPNKVNVCVGAYRDQDGKPWVLPSVHAAEEKLWKQREIKEYLPIEGDAEFVRLAMEFAYGADFPLDHLAAVQTLSGTGACRLGGEFLAQFWPNHPIYVPDPTWGNHISIFKQCGLDVRRYRYYSRQANGLDLRGMLRDLNRAPDGSIILLHACAHNPTGCDPSIEDWKQIVSLCSRKEHVVFFDSAYQGFASGDPEADAQPFRYAVAQGIPILLAQSFAKNFGLYGERVGTLSVVCGDAAQKERITSEMRCLIRPMYSSPPRHGSSIVKTVLQDEVLSDQYRKECAAMAERIKSMRKALVDALKEAGSEHDWSHITQQIGMFAFTGLDATQCQQLTDEFAIFLTTNGRISVAGLNPKNLEYVAEAIHAVSDGKPLGGELRTG